MKITPYKMSIKMLFIFSLNLNLFFSSCTNVKQYTPSRHFNAMLEGKNDFQISGGFGNFKKANLGFAYSPINHLGVYIDLDNSKTNHSFLFGTDKNEDVTSQAIGLGYYHKSYNLESFLSYKHSKYNYDENEDCFIFCNWDSNLAANYKSNEYSWLTTYYSNVKIFKLGLHYKMKYLHFF